MALNKYNPEFSYNPVGFNNIGFTCYYNSLLQGLLSCPSFVEEVMYFPNSGDPVIKLLHYLIRHLKNLDSAPIEERDIMIDEINRLGPVSWKGMIQKLASKSREFAYFAAGQQCVAEGFSLFLQSIEEYKDIQNLFLHRRRNKIFCEDCKSYFSQVDELNNIFEVEPNFEQEVTIDNSPKNLNEFLLYQKNLIDSDCVCTNCKTKSEKIRTSTLVMIPEILFVMSKKYKYNKDSEQGEKIDVYTDFPENLVFKSGRGSVFNYAAVAQIEHLGSSINGGHYYAVCKRKNKWYCINDNNVTEAIYAPTTNTYIVLYHVA